MNFKTTIFSIFFISAGITIYAQQVPLQKKAAVGDRIVEFVPKGFDKNKTPSLILASEPCS